MNTITEQVNTAENDGQIINLMAQVQKLKIEYNELLQFRQNFYMSGPRFNMGNSSSIKSSSEEGKMSHR